MSTHLFSPTQPGHRSKARPRKEGETAPQGEQGLPSPTHPLKDLNETQGLHEQAKVHPQRSHQREQSSLQRPTPPPAHRCTLPQTPLYRASPCAPPCHTPASHRIGDGPTPISLMLGLVPPMATSHWGSSAPKQSPGPMGRESPGVWGGCHCHGGPCLWARVMDDEPAESLWARIRERADQHG